MQKSDEIAVFISSGEATCDECKEKLGRKAWITLDRQRKAFCLACADLDHLLFLPSGDPALTRRARKHSTLSAVVLKWSHARKRYERQGLLVEEKGLREAEEECLADKDVRERRRLREEERRTELDREYIRRFAQRVCEIFPHCPPGRETQIAEHACLKYSGRVGRSLAAKALDGEAVRLAVTAHVRHHETQYDSLLAKGEERYEARRNVQEAIEDILESWS